MYLHKLRGLVVVATALPPTKAHQQSKKPIQCHFGSSLESLDIGQAEAVIVMEMNRLSIKRVKLGVLLELMTSCLNFQSIRTARGSWST